MQNIQIKALDRVRCDIRAGFTGISRWATGLTKRPNNWLLSWGWAWCIIEPWHFKLSSLAMSEKPVTGEFPHKGSVIRDLESVVCVNNFLKKITDCTVKWNALSLRWHHYNAFTARFSGALYCRGWHFYLTIMRGVVGDPYFIICLVTQNQQKIGWIVYHIMWRYFIDL